MARISTYRQERRRFWNEHIREWQNSGITQAAFCKTHGLDPGLFSNWKKRLSEDHDESTGFVELPLGFVSAEGVFLELVLGGNIRINVPVDCPEALLENIFRAARGAMC
jgi:hypothetical protein